MPAVNNLINGSADHDRDGFLHFLVAQRTRLVSAYSVYGLSDRR